MYTSYPSTLQFRILAQVDISNTGDGAELRSHRTHFASSENIVVSIWQTDFPSTQNQGTARQMFCVSFSRDGQLVASGSADNMGYNHSLTTFSGHSGIIYRPTLSPDATLCAS
jgi:WD40 repeat protein